MGIQMNHCQKQSWTCSDSVLISCGNPGRSRTPLYHLRSVRSFHPTPTFRTPGFLTRYVTDSSAFLILLVRARRNLPPRFSGITSLLRVILRDGTLYFMVIFSIQFCSLLVLFVTTVSGIWNVRRCCAHRDYIISKQSRSCPQGKFPFFGVGAAPG